MPWKTRLEISPGCCVLWAALLLTLPPVPVLAAAVAAGFHELCHYAAIRLSGGAVLGLRIGAGGMVMQTLPMTPGREVLCALAGPVGSLLLVGLGRVVPYVAACGLIQGLYNLLPLYPLDGGRVLARCLELAVPRHAARVGAIIEWAVLTVLLAAAVRLGPGAVLAWAMAAVRKIPCKASRFAVQ